MPRIDTTKTDWNGDGVLDGLHETQFIFGADGALNTRLDQDINYTNGTQYGKSISYERDAAGRVTVEHIGEDTDGDGGNDLSSRVDHAYDAAGREVLTTALSPDYNGDGLMGDYTSITSRTYDAAGHLTAQRTDNLAYGTNNGNDYRAETWTYDAAGRLTEYCVDDPMLFDCEITKTYNYKNGVLQNIKETNEIRFGDERPHIDESFTWNSDGTPKTHTSWADYSDKGYFQRVDDNYTSWDGKGYDADKVIYDREGNFKPEQIKLVENWFNSDGRLTHTLVSHDDGADGGPLAGGGAASGYDRRDMTVQTWNGADMVSQTIDIGNDGILESDFSSVWLIA